MTDQSSEFIPFSSLNRVLYIDQIIADPFKESFSVDMGRFYPSERAFARPAHYTELVFLRLKGKPINYRFPSVNECRDLLYYFIFVPVDPFVPREPPPNVVHAYQLCPKNRIDGAPAIVSVLVFTLARDDFARNSNGSPTYVLEL